MSNSQKPLVLYGIKNCDTCRKAQRWLQERDISFSFHDFRIDGLTEELLEGWLKSSLAPSLINRRSTTWRTLSNDQKGAAETNPQPLLLANPTLIKRPVITDGSRILQIGFSPASLEEII